MATVTPSIMGGGISLINGITASYKCTVTYVKRWATVSPNDDTQTTTMVEIHARPENYSSLGITNNYFVSISQSTYFDENPVEEGDSVYVIIPASATLCQDNVQATSSSTYWILSRFLTGGAAEYPNTEDDVAMVEAAFVEYNKADATTTGATKSVAIARSTISALELVVGTPAAAGSTPDKANRYYEHYSNHGQTTVYRVGTESRNGKFNLVSVADNSMRVQTVSSSTNWYDSFYWFDHLPNFVACRDLLGNNIACTCSDGQQYQLYYSGSYKYAQIFWSALETIVIKA